MDPVGEERVAMSSSFEVSVGGDELTIKRGSNIVESLELGM